MRANYRPTQDVRTGGDAANDSIAADSLKSDTVDLMVDEQAVVAQGFLITTDGDLKVTTRNGREVTYPVGTFTAKSFIPLRIRRIWSTGTSATGIYIFFD